MQIWDPSHSHYRQWHTVCSQSFRNFYEAFQIEQKFSLIHHPQTNGQAELVNRIILQGLKKRLELEKTNWVDHLFNILWSYRTTPRDPTSETPFTLCYGSEVVVLVEIREINFRTEELIPVNVQEIHVNLDLLPER